MRSKYLVVVGPGGTVWSQHRSKKAADKGVARCLADHKRNAPRAKITCKVMTFTQYKKRSST